MAVYYNEHDPFAAAWLRELIKANLIAPGEVDERSIEDVVPAELVQYSQCHFFAGIGVWSYALRQAGWADDRRIWTGSCPCQPFSASGKGEGFADERHLWPAWFHLISQCRPDVVIGEQVASRLGLTWFDLVQDDLENAHYAVGATDTCAAGYGAPHLRQRLYFVADSGRRRREQRDEGQRPIQQPDENRSLVELASAKPEGLERAECSVLERKGNGRQDPDATRSSIANSELAHTQHDGRDGASTDATEPSGNGLADRLLVGSDSGLCGTVADTDSERRQQDSGSPLSNEETDGREGRNGSKSHGNHVAPSNGQTFWHDAEWIYCKDGKYRPVKPGLPVLVNGAPNRVGRLRGFGNSLVAPQAIAFIESYMEILNES